MTSPWTIEGEIARLHKGTFSGELHLAWPQRGLHNVSLDGVRLGDAASHFLAVMTRSAEQAETIQDFYVRGDDLVVTYAETAERNIRPQVYWRAFEFPDDSAQAYGVDVIVSTQTSQLYSDPTLMVESGMPAIDEHGSVAAGVAGPILFRLNPPAWSFAQAVHPRDFDTVHSSIDSEGRAEVQHRIFAPGLEKGVIRRAQVRGIFVPRVRDEALAAASYEDFVRHELPLTT